MPRLVNRIAHYALCAAAAAPVRERPAELRLPPRVGRNWPEVRDSLVRSRGLDPALLEDGFACGIIHADERRNAVFVARDGAGRTAGAEIVDTRRAQGWRGFRGMAPGSSKARGGFWLAAKDGEPASALLVESAIDALSVLTRPPPGHGHDLVVSTAGVCTAVPKWLGAFGLTRIDCGFDADSAGNRAAGREGMPRLHTEPGADVRQCWTSVGRNTQNRTKQSGKPATDHSEVQQRSRPACRPAARVRTARSNRRSGSSRVLEQGVDPDPREGFGRTAHAAVQGSTTSMPVSSKSRTLRVATAMPRARAIAAIWPSAGATMRPAERRVAAISA